MRYCHGCGSKIEAEDVFCTNCGTKQVQASSTQEKQFQQNQQSAEYSKFDNSNAERGHQDLFNSYNNLKSQVNFSQGGNILLKMLIKPVEGAKQFVETSEKGFVIAITLVLAIMQGILGVWKVNQLISSLQNLVIDIIQKITTLMNLIEPGSTGKVLGSNEIMELTTQINKLKSFINIPYGKIFLQNSTLFLISIAILFIILYLGTSILSKNRVEAFTIYKIALIVTVPTIYFQILAVVFSYLSFYIGLVVGIIGVIISIGCLTITVKEELPINENHSVFIVAISCIAIFISVSIALQSFLSSNISDIVMSLTNVMKTFKF